MIERHYETDDGRPVLVTLSIPQVARPNDPHSEWQVMIRSSGLESNFVQPVYGVDGVQAMELAIQLLVTIEEVEGLVLPD
ncbi:MAG: hypothetical protein Q4C87_11190 [Actinomycetaceae bacterium]|nr:hypothetical protein [Actinomycetaceae bacterium]